jgi:hypothetical protein
MATPKSSPNKRSERPSSQSQPATPTRVQPKREKPLQSPPNKPGPKFPSDNKPAPQSPAKKKRVQQSPAKDKPAPKPKKRKRRGKRGGKNKDEADDDDTPSDETTNEPVVKTNDVVDRSIDETTNKPVVETGDADASRPDEEDLVGARSGKPTNGSDVGYESSASSEQLSLSVDDDLPGGDVDDRPIDETTNKPVVKPATPTLPGQKLLTNW